jgi:hypothetical protein
MEGPHLSSRPAVRDDYNYSNHMVPRAEGKLLGASSSAFAGKVLLLNAARRARALRRYTKDQQAGNRTVYPTYDLEEKLKFRIMGPKVLDPAQNDSPRVIEVLLDFCLVNPERRGMTLT